MSINGHNKQRGRASDGDEDEPRSHRDTADRGSPSTSRVEHSQQGSRVDGSFSAPLLTQPAHDSGSDDDDSDGSARNGGSRMETFVANGIRKSGSGRSLADEAARYDPPLLNLEGQQSAAAAPARSVTFIAGVAGMNRSQSTLSGALANHRQQQQQPQSSAVASSSRAAPATAAAASSSAKPNGDDTTTTTSARWQQLQRDHDDDDHVAMVVGSAPL